MLKRCIFSATIAIVLVAALATSAFAIPVQPNLTLQVQWNTGTWNSDPSAMVLVQDTSDPNKWTYSGGHTTAAQWAATWSGNVDTDPAINSAIAITNNSAVNQTFTTTLTLPTVGAPSAPTQMAGGTTVTVSGAGVVQSAFTPAGDFVYLALTGSGGFVGAPADLLPPPFTLTSGPLGLPNSAGPFNFGPVNGPGLLAIDSISIRHSFTLTPGASATLNGTFIIVPEPATLSLLPLAGLAFARRRRA